MELQHRSNDIGTRGQSFPSESEIGRPGGVKIESILNDRSLLACSAVDYSINYLANSRGVVVHSLEPMYKIAV